MPKRSQPTTRAGQKREKKKEKAVFRETLSLRRGNTQGWQEILREPLRQPLEARSYDIADEKLSLVHYAGYGRRWNPRGCHKVG